MKIMTLPKPPFAIELAKKKIIIPVTIEDLISESQWETAQQNGWLTPRSQDQIKQILMPTVPPDKSMIDFQQEVLDDLGIKQELFTHTVRDERKQAFCTDAIKKSDTNPDIFINFKSLINSIEEFFQR